MKTFLIGFGIGVAIFLFSLLLSGGCIWQKETSNTACGVAVLIFNLPSVLIYDFISNHWFVNTIVEKYYFLVSIPIFNGFILGTFFIIIRQIIKAFKYLKNKYA
jgi:hypothetical protein